MPALGQGSQTTLVLRGVNYRANVWVDGTLLADMTRSELLRQPEIGGGFAHQDIHFWRPGDPDYQAIRRWLEGATLGRVCNSGN